MAAYQTLKKAAAIGGLFVCAIAASYLLAKAGEPSSVWLWHDILGIAH